MSRLKKTFSVLFSLVLFAQQFVFALPSNGAAMRDYSRFRRVYSSDGQTPEAMPAETFNKIEKFNKKTRSTWNIRMNRKSGVPRSLTGGKDLRVGRTESAALSFLNSNKDFLGVDRKQLRLKLQRKSAIGSHFYFDQYYKNLKVETAYVKVNVDNSGALLNYQSTYIPDIKIDIKPSKTALEASSIAASDAAGGTAGKAELVIYPNPENKEPVLTWKIEVQGGPSESGKWTYFISALDGTIVNRVSRQMHVTEEFKAKVYPVYPGFTDNGTPVPQEDKPLSDLKVYVANDTKDYSTDINGEVDFPFNPRTGRVFATFSGKYFTVNNQAAQTAYYVERGVDGNTTEPDLTRWATFQKPSGTPYPMYDICDTYTHTVTNTTKGKNHKIGDKLVYTAPLPATAQLEVTVLSTIHNYKFSISNKGTGYDKGYMVKTDASCGNKIFFILDIDSDGGIKTLFNSTSFNFNDSGAHNNAVCKLYNVTGSGQNAEILLEIDTSKIQGEIDKFSFSPAVSEYDFSGAIISAGSYTGAAQFKITSEQQYNAFSDMVFSNDFNVGSMDIYGSIGNKVFLQAVGPIPKPSTIIAQYIGRPGKFHGPLMANRLGTSSTMGIGSYPSGNLPTTLPIENNFNKLCIPVSFTGNFDPVTTHNMPGFEEASAYYNLSAMREFFQQFNKDGSGNSYIDLDTHLPVVVNARGTSSDTMKTAFYDIDAKVLMFGQGRKSGSQHYSFALESAIVRHEYVHAVVDRIWPIMRFGEGVEASGGEGAAISEALSDYFALSSLVDANGKHYTSKIGEYVFGSNNSSVRDLATQKSFDPVLWEKNAFSDYYANSLVLSSTLWDLRKNPGGTIGPDTDKILWNALMFFPDSLLEMRDAMIAADRALNGGSNVSAIETAFNTHNITYADIITQYGGGDDIYEPNNSPDSAADIDIASIVKKEINAKINPISDIDFYSISLPPGEFEAKLYLPQMPPNYYPQTSYYPLALLLLNANLKTVVNIQRPLLTGGQSNQATFSEYVQLKYTVPETTNGGTGRYIIGVFKPKEGAYPLFLDGASDPLCLTTPPDIRCHFDIISIFCSANPTDARCGAKDNTGKYKLVFNYARGTNVGSVNTTVPNFNTNTIINFEVPCNTAGTISTGSIPSFLKDWDPQSVEAFDSARLLDENMNIIKKYGTKDADTYLCDSSCTCSTTSPYCGSCSTPTTPACASNQITSSVKLCKSLEGTGHDLIYLQVLGKIRSNKDANSESIPLCSSSNPPPTPCYRDDYGIVSLGISNPIRNDARRSMEIYIRDQIFNPAKGGKVKIQLNAKQNGHIKAQIFTVDGILVKSLYDGQITTALPEFIDWDGKNDSGNTVASGVYLLRVDGAGIDRQVKKIVAVK